MAAGTRRQPLARAPSLPALLQPLQALRQPTVPLYRLLTEADAEPRGSLPTDAAAAATTANRIVIDGAPVDVGFSVDLTIDPSLQALAQKTAACYIGPPRRVPGDGIRRAEDADRPLGSRSSKGDGPHGGGGR